MRVSLHLRTSMVAIVLFALVEAAVVAHNAMFSLPAPTTKDRQNCALIINAGQTFGAMLMCAQGKWKLGPKIGSGSYGTVHKGLNDETGQVGVATACAMQQ